MSKSPGKSPFKAFNGYEQHARRSYHGTVSPSRPFDYHEDVEARSPHGYYYGRSVIIFIIVAVVAGLILNASKPQIVRARDSEGNVTDEVDTGRLVVASILIALLITLLLAVFAF